MKFFEHQDPELKFKLFAYPIISSLKIKYEDILCVNDLLIFLKLSDELRQKQFLQSRFWLKKHLSDYLNKEMPSIEIAIGLNGKPQLIHNYKQIDFNISHCEDLIFIGISDQGNIGVDIEKTRTPNHLEQIAKRIFSINEQKSLMETKTLKEKEILFTKLWSGKESIVKAASGGVFLNSHEISINCSNWSIENLPQSFGNLNLWKLNFYEDIKFYTLSMAFRKN